MDLEKAKSWLTNKAIECERQAEMIRAMPPHTGPGAPRPSGAGGVAWHNEQLALAIRTVLAALDK